MSSRRKRKAVTDTASSKAKKATDPSATTAPSRDSQASPAVQPPQGALPVPDVSQRRFKSQAWIDGAAARKRKAIRNLKAAVNSAKFSQYPPSCPTYTSVQAGPSILPHKKYCDISGLPARYTDPRTQLRYYSVQHYAFIQSLQHDTVTQYLDVRDANVQLR